jgi:hypothetical protein
MPRPKARRVTEMEVCLCLLELGCGRFKLLVGGCSQEKVRYKNTLSEKVRGAYLNHCFEGRTRIDKSSRREL